MRHFYGIAVLFLSMSAPRITHAQASARSSVSLGSLEIAASALGKHVVFELGLSLEVVRERWAVSRTAEFWEDSLLGGTDSVASHWSAYGEALYRDGRHRESIAAFQRAMQLGVHQPGDAALSVARAYARLGNRKQALRWVERALDLGGISRDSIRDEREFEPYHDDPSFRDLIAPADAFRARIADVNIRARVTTMDR